MSSDARWDFKWRDKEVIKLAEDRLGDIMAEFALVAEGEAKKELQKTGGTPRRDRRKGRSKNIISPHGLVTGTLRRSVHVANIEYNFSGDDVVPSGSTPERGKQKINPTKIGNKLTLSLGSGLKYAMKVHQGWGRFAGYHYLTIGVEKAKAKKDAIIARHQVK